MPLTTRLPFCSKHVTPVAARVCARWRNLAISLLSLCLLIGACSDDDHPSVESVPPDDETVITSDAGADPIDADPPACKEGSFELCACTNGAGKRHCVGGAYGSCEGCEANMTGSENKCVPGHYEGRVETDYVPTPAGLCGLFTLFSGSGTGTWAFDLAASSDDEFYEVRGDTCITLTIDPPDGGAPAPGSDGGMPSPKMKLTGKVDCTTGIFTGEVRGTYRSVSFCSLGMGEDDYFFKGPVSARFNPTTRAFEDGTLKLREPPVILPIAGEPGGDGTWSAALIPDAGEAPDREDCLKGLRFPDELFL